MYDRSLESEARKALQRAGLAGAEILRYAVGDVGDSEVVFEVGPVLLRFLRDRGQVFVDLGAAASPGSYFQFVDVDVAMGWQTTEQVSSRSEPEEALAILKRLKQNFPQIVEAFSDARLGATLAELEATSRRRGEAFLEYLRAGAQRAIRDGSK